MLTSLMIAATAMGAPPPAYPGPSTKAYIGGAFLPYDGGVNPYTGVHVTKGVGVVVMGSVKDGVLVIADCHDNAYRDDGRRAEEQREMTGAPTGLKRVSGEPGPAYNADNVGEARLQVTPLTGPPHPGTNRIRVTVRYDNVFRGDGWWQSEPIGTLNIEPGNVRLGAAPVRLERWGLWYEGCDR